MRISERMEKAVEESDDTAIIRFLDEGEDINAKTRQKSILLLAAINNDTALVKTLLDKGADPQVSNIRHKNNLLDYSDATPLYHAIEHTNESMVIALLDAGASYSGRSGFPDHLDSTAIKHAFSRKNEGIVTLLKARGARINVSAVKPVFVDFLINNDPQGMKFMLAQMPERGQLALVNSSTIAGEALTVYALRMKNRPMFDLLMSYGADIDNTNSRGERALTYAIDNNDTELVRFAIEKGAKKEFIYGYAHSPITSLQASVDKNNIEVVRLILSGCEKKGESVFVNLFKRRKCENLNYNHSRGIGTPLKLAADNKNTEIVKLLLEYGADPNVKDNNDNWVPAINSISKDDFKTFKILMDAGTHLDSISGLDSAIGTAIYSNSEEILRYLLEKEVDQFDLDNRLNYTLADDVDTGLLKALLDSGANAAWINRRGESQAMDRIKTIKVEALKILIDAGLDVNVRSKKGETLLSEAVYWDRADIIDVLLEHGAIDKRVTPLHIAVVNNDLKKVKSLLNTHHTERSDRVTGIDTPLVIAAGNNHYTALKLFIESGADVNTKSEKGDTLLVMAIQKEYAEIIDLLLKNNASADLLGSSGRLPLNMAIDNKDTGLMLKLLKSGADVFFKHKRDEYNSVDSPFYKAYFRCNKCLAVILDFKYSRYLNNEVDLNDIDKMVEESRDHVLDVLRKALDMKNRLLLKMVSAKIAIDKDDLLKHHKYASGTYITSVFYLVTSENIDFEWQEYVFDTLPFIDENYDKDYHAHSITYNNSSVGSSLVTLIHNRDKFPQALIVMAIDVDNEEQAIKMLKSSAHYKSRMDLDEIYRMSMKKGYIDLSKLLAEMGAKMQ